MHKKALFQLLREMERKFKQQTTGAKTIFGVLEKRLFENFGRIYKYSLLIYNLARNIRDFLGLKSAHHLFFKKGQLALNLTICNTNKIVSKCQPFGMYFLF